MSCHFKLLNLNERVPAFRNHENVTSEMEGRLVSRLFRTFGVLKRNIRLLSLSAVHYAETETRNDQDAKQTHFGFQTVPEEVKEEKGAVLSSTLV